MALCHQPRERLSQGHFRFATTTGNGYGVLRIRVAHAAPNPQGHGERGIQGDLRSNRGDRRDLRGREAAQGEQT